MKRIKTIDCPEGKVQCESFELKCCPPENECCGDKCCEKKQVCCDGTCCENGCLGLKCAPA